jgi:hypothetical protein
MLPISQVYAPLAIAIPTAKRPELLALTLEKLSESRLPSNVDVRIYADTDANLDDIDWVRDRYFPEALMFHAPKHVEAPSGCWNILNSIKQSYLATSGHVILLEEDVSVRPWFYEHHLNTANGHQVLASCGRKDKNFYPLYPDLYTNPGSCLKRELVANLIPHINDDYFTRLREYMDEHFGPWDTQSNLDDGLIRRVIRQMGGRAVYPDTPICAHQGWRFYNKLDLYMNFEVGIENRIRRLREIIKTIRPGDRYASDFEPF